jgi:hypothetical protein
MLRNETEAIEGQLKVIHNKLDVLLQDREQRLAGDPTPSTSPSSGPPSPPSPETSA